MTFGELMSVTCCLTELIINYNDLEIYYNASMVREPLARFTNHKIELIQIQNEKLIIDLKSTH